MASLSITNTAVKPTSSTQIVSGTKDLTGETYTAGMYVYKKSDGKWWKAQSDGVAAEAGVKGMALADSLVAGAAALVGVGEITIGSHGITVGLPYYLSATAGLSCPIADIVATNYVSGVGKFKTATTIVVAPDVSGIIHG